MKLNLFARLSCLLLSLAPNASLGVVSFQNSTSFGYYKDLRQSQRFPFYSSLSYQGLHEKGIETSFQLLLNNDFSQNAWKVQPALGSVVVPLSTSRPSQIEAGRIFWAEGFDLTLLDGAQLPFYFSQTGGIFLYGGSTHSMDLFDDKFGSLVGGSLFEQIEGFHLRAGWMGRDAASKRQSLYASAYKALPNWFWEPNFLLKQEWGLAPTNYGQSLGEVVLYPVEDLSFIASYSYREPRPYTDNESDFLYRLFSMTPQQTQEYSTALKISEQLRWQLETKWSLFNSSSNHEDRGQQQDMFFEWQLDRRNQLIPSVGHLKSYGGEVWNSGVKYKLNLNDKVDWLAEFFTAQIEKVDNIHGWAQHFRTGVNCFLATHTSAMAWFELERNHQFEFDGRIMGSVTQYY